MVSGAERLDEGGSNRMLLGLRVGDRHDDVLGAWLAKESVRDVYPTDDPAVAATLLDKVIAGCGEDDVEEIRSLGSTRVVASRDPGSPRERCVQRSNRRAEPVRQAGQALRPRLQAVRALPPARAAARRWHHVAE